MKPTAEMQFLYGNHVLKSGLGRITEGTPAYTGVVIYSMTDVPSGVWRDSQGHQRVPESRPQRHRGLPSVRRGRVPEIRGGFVDPQQP